MTRSTLHGLYAITDSQLMPDTESMLLQVEHALRGGAQIIQYRDKSSNARMRAQQASALLDLCNRYQRLLLINDDITLAKQVGAHGVHLGQSDGSLTYAREALGKHAVIGVTCHASLALAHTARQDGCDYVAFGAFFPSQTKPDAQPAPLALLAEARSILPVPVVAIGGITLDNAAQVIHAGADMVAVIHNLFANDDISAQAARYERLFTR